MADTRQPSNASRPVTAPGTFRVFTLFGFDVLIHWSWIFIFVLLTWSLESGYLPEVYPEWTSSRRWAVGAITSALFFASVLAHEVAHALVARRRGVAVQHITLYIFGGASALAGEPRSARDEFWISIVGPLTSLASAMVFAVIWLVASQLLELRSIYPIAGYLAYINVMLGIFNLLPGFPLDGGRVLRSVLWGVKRNMLEATRIAGNVGRLFAGLLIAGGVLVAMAGALLSGFWLIFIGWFLWNAAETAYHQLLLQTTLRGLMLGPIVDRDVPRIPPDVTLRQLAHDYILRLNRRAFFVSPVEEGEIMGLITLADLHKAPEEQWDSVSVYRAMTPRERLVAATPQTEAIAALQQMAEHNINQILIVDGREPIGLVSRGDLIGAIQLRNEVKTME